MKRIIILLAIISVISGCTYEKIYVSDLQDKIAGAWIGQMVGNMYGLPHENKYIENPGPQDKWPYGYSKSLDKLEKYEGAFSDDDTVGIPICNVEKYGFDLLIIS